MKITPFFSYGYPSNMYYITDDKETAGVLIDPSMPPDAFVSRCGSERPLCGVILTHGHFDHMLCLDEYRATYHVPVYIGRADAPFLLDASLNLYQRFLNENKTYSPAEYLLSVGDTVAVGREQLRISEMPGHTPGSIVCFSENFAVTGDLLFDGGAYGRTDFPGGDEAAMQCSLKKFRALSEGLTLYPGHGEAFVLSHSM